MDNYLKNKISSIKNSDITLFNRLRQIHSFCAKVFPKSTEENNTKTKDNEETDFSDKYFTNINISENKPLNFHDHYIKFLEIKKEALAIQNGKLKELFPKSLLYIALLALPALLLYSLGFYRTSYSPSAGRAIQIIALIMPLIFFGPLRMGYLSGILNEIRTGNFNEDPSTNTLFFAFNDKYFIKSILTFLLNSALVLAPMLPAIILNSFSNNLFFNVVNAGFAYIATKILCALLWTAGIIASIHIWLRLSLTFPIIIDNINIKPINAIKFSFKTMKQNCITLFILIFSYAGWYLLALGAALLFILIIGSAIYIYIQSISNTVTAYMYLIYSILAIYIVSYITLTFSISAIIARPTIGLATFYNKLLIIKTNYTPDITNITDFSEIADLPNLSNDNTLSEETDIKTVKTKPAEILQDSIKENIC